MIPSNYITFATMDVQSGRAITSSTTQQPFQHYSGSTTTTTSTTRQTAKFITTALLGTSMLVLSGLTLTGTVIGLAITTPLFVLFSPVLVPAMLTTLMIITGFLFSGGSGVAGLVGFTWIYNYITGKRPVGTDQIDEIGGKARDMKDFVKDYTKTGQTRADQDIRSRT